jgi:hypothetical protein
MREIFNLSFSAPNIIPTILVLVTALYWILVLFGFLDLNSGDLDLDKDISLDKDLSLDADGDAHMEANGHAHASADKDLDSSHNAEGDSIWVATLRFFNLGEVPFMAFFSFMSLFTWTISLPANYYLGNHGFWLGLALLVPTILVSAFLTKFATWPLKKLFKSLNEVEKPFEFTGRICTIEVGTFGDKVGQAQIEADGKVILISVRSHDGSRFNAGQKAVVLDEWEENSSIYLVGPFQEGTT